MSGLSYGFKSEEIRPTDQITSKTTQLIDALQYYSLPSLFTVYQGIFEIKKRNIRQLCLENASIKCNSENNLDFIKIILCNYYITWGEIFQITSKTTQLIDALQYCSLPSLFTVYQGIFEIKKRNIRQLCFENASIKCNSKNNLDFIKTI